MMYPSKERLDYMSEINRYFPKTNENNIPETSSTLNSNASIFQSSPNYYSMLTSHSSSSADSVSPDTFPDVSLFLNNASSLPDIHTRSYDTLMLSDSTSKKQRPIVGRKILGNSEFLSTIMETPVKVSQRPSTFDNDFELPQSIWHMDDQSLSPQTPPKRSLMEQKYKRNVYELFPTENRGYEFKIPNKAAPRTSSCTNTNVSPNIFSTPSNFETSTPIKPNFPPNYQSTSQFNSNYFNLPNANFVPSSSKYNEAVPSTKLCTFCRKNGETPLVYLTHSVKEKIGNRNIVTCPILRSHVCTTCGASGDNAHTMTYCPVLRSGNNGMPLMSTTITLKNTRVKSNGRRRY